MALFVLLGVLAYFALTACQVMPKAEAPEWDPDIFVYSPEEGRCEFVSDYGSVIPCENKKLVCLEAEQFKVYKQNLRRCEEWR